MDEEDELDAMRELENDYLDDNDDNLFTFGDEPEEGNTKKRPRSAQVPADTEVLPKAAPSPKKPKSAPENRRSADDDDSIFDLTLPSQRLPYTSKKGFSERPLMGDCIYITSAKGDRVYLEIDPEDEPVSPLPSTSSAFRFGGLQNVRARALQEEEYEAFQRSKQAADDVQEVGKYHSPKTELWVDKYSPKSFVELLSDEKTNRSVLSWLKEWDAIVFKRPVTVVARQQQQGHGHTTSGHGGSNASSAPIGATSGLSHQPNFKIILLSGPPGIGKTTLAHIIARHAGYEPVEFNASDDRSEKTFLPKVLDVIETASVFDENMKPKCLIIDEIDGVLGGEGKGAIHALVKLVEEHSRDPTKKDGSTSKLKRPIICICNDAWVPALKPLREKAQLFRLEPPTLSSLTTRLHHICQKEGIRVDNGTLQVLCELTNRDIRACLHALQFLSAKSKVITANLLTSAAVGSKDLQANIFDVWKTVFVKEQKSPLLQNLIQERRRKELAASASFSLPSGSSILPSQDSTRPPPSHGTGSTSLVDTHTDRVISAVIHSDTDKVLEGVAEHYTHVRYSDPIMSKTSSAASWLEVSSLLWKGIRAEQHFVLGAYLPVVAAGVSHNCSVSYLAKPFTFPRGERQLRTQTEATQNLMTTFLMGVTPKIFPVLGRRSAGLDFMSLFLRVCAPNIRPFPLQILEQHEKKRFLELISIYSSYGMTYEDQSSGSSHQHQSQHPHSGSAHGASSVYRLKPPIDTLAHWDTMWEALDDISPHAGGYGKRRYGSAASKPISAQSQRFFDASLDLHPIIQANDAQRQLIAQYIAGAARAPDGTLILPSDTPTAATSTSSSSTTSDNAKRGPSSPIKKVQPKEETVSVARDFFGRPIVKPITNTPNPSQSSGNSDTTGAPKSAASVTYKWQEGFTNAVRRKVLIKDLL